LIFGSAGTAVTLPKTDFMPIAFVVVRGASLEWGTVSVEVAPGSARIVGTAPGSREIAEVQIAGSDRDGDGVPDNLDVCPDTPGPPSSRGCPPK